MKKVFSRLVFLVVAVLVATVGWDYWREHRYDRQINAAAARYQVAPALVRAVVWRESRFNTYARGSKGERGLMQIRLPAAQDWAAAENIVNFNPESLFDPATNTAIGAWYLARLLKRYSDTDNPLPYALADYNAGRSNVLKWTTGGAATNSTMFIEQIQFPGTRRYIETVTARCLKYQKPSLL